MLSTLLFILFVSILLSSLSLSVSRPLPSRPRRVYSLCSVSAESLLSAPRSIFTLWDHRGVGWFRSYLGTRILDKFLVVGLFQTPRLPENIWSPVVACLAVVSCPLRLLLPVSRFVLASKRSFSVAEVTRNPFNLLHRMPRADAPFREEPFAANLPFLLSLSLSIFILTRTARCTIIIFAHRAFLNNAIAVCLFGRKRVVVFVVCSLLFCQESLSTLSIILARRSRH